MMRLSRITRHARVALHRARNDAAAGHRAHAGDVEDLLHQHAAQFGFPLLRLEHSFEGRLEVLGHLVDDVVASDLDAQLIGQHAGLFVGHDVEADDHGVRGIGQMHVGLGDAADDSSAAP